MNSEYLERFRNQLLHQLTVASPRPLRVPALQIGVRCVGFDFDDKQLVAELQYLADKGFVTTVEKSLSPENQHWRITAEGRDHVAANPLG